jgi:hypothetical protein
MQHEITQMEQAFCVEPTVIPKDMQNAVEVGVKTNNIRFIAKIH